MKTKFELWMGEIEKAEIAFNAYQDAVKSSDLQKMEEAHNKWVAIMNDCEYAFQVYNAEKKSERITQIESEEWNPYTDGCYLAEDKADKAREDREYAIMQATAGWHKESTTHQHGRIGYHFN